MTRTVFGFSIEAGDEARQLIESVAAVHHPNGDRTAAAPRAAGPWRYRSVNTEVGISRSATDALDTPAPGSGR